MWKEVALKDEGAGVERDQFNQVTFAEPVTTSKLRIEMELHEGLSAAMLACRFNMERPEPVKTFADPDKELARIKKKAEETLTADVDEFNG